MLGLFILICLQIFLKFFSYFHVGGPSTSFFKSPSASDGLESVGIFLSSPLFLLDQGAATEEAGNALRVSLTPQRLYHPQSSLLASQIHQRNVKYENSPRCSQFLRAYSPACATCEERSPAQLWEYGISCHWCLVNQHPIPRKGGLCSHVPATCRNVAEPPWREGGASSGVLVTAPRHLTWGFRC